MHRLKQIGSTNGTVIFGAGFGPSGIPHIGTLCEVIRTSFVCRAFEELTGRPTRLVVVADDMDAMRAIPGGFPETDMLAAHLGIPLFRVPDPFGRAASLSDGMIDRLRNALDAMDVEYELVRSSAAYLAGEYDRTIREFLADLPGLNELIGRSVSPVRRASYSVFMPISANTGQVLEHTRVLDVDPAAGTITYEIPEDVVIQRPGMEYGAEPHEVYPHDPIGEPITVSALGGACKLQWKADWSLRLLSRDTAYEMHGEDLTGSANVVRSVFHRLDRVPPVLFSYGLFVDERGRKISKSIGNGFSLADVRRLLTPESLRLLLYRQPHRLRRFGPAMTPAINDAVHHETRRAADPHRGGGARLRLRRVNAPTQVTGPRFGTLARILDACAPVDAADASTFVRRYFHDVDPVLVAKVWAFHETRRARARTCEPGDSALLYRLADALDAEPSDPAKALATVLDGVPDHRAAYRKFYLALLGRPHGPRLVTWLRITGARRAAGLLRATLPAIAIAASVESGHS
ncbi:hypothetical protein LWC34_11900 [Kibdelosporangium philippinense]|uniref:Lysine--tRNA ligase n=2 Tax=Kibdelosporangium philippinense TaxID=211113 RepID=A0ABS8Z6M9_9PSEU|nr:hypothetical protein [Kibdelosporangium philippinense]